jgi:hypothetical protein
VELKDVLSVPLSREGSHGVGPLGLFSPLPFCPRFIQLPLKRIFREPANFLPESNQLFVRHLAQSIPQLPQNFFV